MPQRVLRQVQRTSPLLYAPLAVIGSRRDWVQGIVLRSTAEVSRSGPGPAQRWGEFRRLGGQLIGPRCGSVALRGAFHQARGLQLAQPGVRTFSLTSGIRLGNSP